MSKIKSKKKLTGLVNNLLQGKKILESWRKSNLIPIPRREDVGSCGSYRSGKLFKHDVDVIEMIFEKQLKDLVKLNEMQMSFMSGRRTIMRFLYYNRCWGNMKWQEGSYALCQFGKSILIMSQEMIWSAFIKKRSDKERSAGH